MEIIDFFQGLESDASLFILIVAVVSFLMGILILWLLLGSRIRRLRRALKASDQELNKANEEIKGLKDRIQTLEDEAERLKYDLHESKVKADRLETERTQFYNESFQLKDSLEMSKNAQARLDEELEAKKIEIINLESTNEQLLKQIEFLEEQLEKDDAKTDDLAQMQSVFIATKQRLDALEDRLHSVEQENVLLKQSLYTQAPATQDVPNNGPLESSVLIDKTDNTVKPVLPSEIDTGLVEEEPEFSIQDEKPGINRKIDLTEYDKDNLTLIEGIGPFLEKKLNEVGIFSFAQLAALNEQDIVQLTRAIGHIPGRIEQDNWVGQAANLKNSQIEDSGTLSRSVSFSVPEPEDLTVIEGIGPQLQTILKEAGINNWNDLAETDDEQLTSILIAAGPGYRIVDTSSWPAQAQLALKGEWELLREYREEVNDSN